MNYSMIRVNGQYGTNMGKITKGQLDYVLKEIDLQKQGYGYLGRGKSYESYMDYWLNWPGKPVR